MCQEHAWSWLVPRVMQDHPVMLRLVFIFCLYWQPPSSLRGHVLSDLLASHSCARHQLITVPMFSMYLYIFRVLYIVHFIYRGDISNFGVLPCAYFAYCWSGSLCITVHYLSDVSVYSEILINVHTGNMIQNSFAFMTDADFLVLCC